MICARFSGLLDLGTLKIAYPAVWADSPFHATLDALADVTAATAHHLGAQLNSSFVRAH